MLLGLDGGTEVLSPASGHVGWVVRKWVVTPLRGVFTFSEYFSFFGLRSVSEQAHEPRVSI